jgi:hypothetical protein
MWDYVQQLLGSSAGTGMPQFGPTSMDMPQFGPAVPLPDVGTPNPWDPTGTPNQNVPVPQPRPILPPGMNPGAAPGANPGFYGGAPASNPNLQPQAGAAQPPAGNRIADALKGMVAPKVPEPQKVGTPAPYHPVSRIPGGNIAQLLQLLHGSGGLQLPNTLGAALGGR